jgi:hypothetical protein
VLTGLEPAVNALKEHPLQPFAYSTKLNVRKRMAWGLGFEPRISVLETEVLPITPSLHGFGSSGGTRTHIDQVMSLGLYR